MQNPKLKTWRNFDRVYIPAKSKIKSKKYHNIKCDISLKNYRHAEFKILDWKQF